MPCPIFRADRSRFFQSWNSFLFIRNLTLGVIAAPFSWASHGLDVATISTQCPSWWRKAINSDDQNTGATGGREALSSSPTLTLRSLNTLDDDPDQQNHISKTILRKRLLLERLRRNWSGLKRWYGECHLSSNSTSSWRLDRCGYHCPWRYIHGQLMTQNDWQVHFSLLWSTEAATPIHEYCALR